MRRSKDFKLRRSGADVLATSDASSNLALSIEAQRSNGKTPGSYPGDSWFNSSLRHLAGTPAPYKLAEKPPDT